MKVKYIRDVDQPEFLRGKVGDIRDLEGAYALRLWMEGYVEVTDPPDGLAPLSDAAKQ